MPDDDANDLSPSSFRSHAVLQLPLAQQIHSIFIFHLDTFFLHLCPLRLGAAGPRAKENPLHGHHPIAKKARSFAQK